jgi:DNA-binding response OmpR family regulator
VPDWANADARSQPLCESVNLIDESSEPAKTSQILSLMDRSSHEKVLVVDPDNALGTSIATVLSEAGYEVSTDYREEMNSVLTLNPDAVILGANPPQLDYCDLLSEIKGSERTQNIRVLMVSRGGSGERTRGLDLGADDVVSLPIDPHELLSRVRWQLRNKRIIEELRAQVHTIKENQDVAKQVMTAVSQERRSLRVGVIVALVFVAITGAAFLMFYHRTQQQNTRVYAAITRLQTGMFTEQKLIDRSHLTVEEAQANPSSASDSEKRRLQKQSKDLRSHIAAGNAENTTGLQGQLSSVENRLQRLETEGKVAQTIIESYEPSVCLIHVVVGFRDRVTGLNLHYASLTSTGEPVRDDQGNPLVGRATVRKYTLMFSGRDFSSPTRDKSSLIIMSPSLGGTTTI